MKEQIRQIARGLGFDDCRFSAAGPPRTGRFFEEWLSAGNHGEMGWMARNAEKRLDPARVLARVQSVVVLAASYHSSPEQHTHPGEGVIARYARGVDYHDVLAEKLKQLSKQIVEVGGEGTQCLWYADTGPILERDLAQRAGLGFAGKHTNLISRKLGNWFFICEVLTNLALEPDTAEPNRCGTCERCLQSCPTQAIRGPFQLDARRCISYLTIELKGAIPVELRPLVGNRIFGCDDCLAACPWNRFAREGQLVKQDPKMANPDLLELLTLDEAGFKARFAGTPMARTKRRGLLRNVCVALGNTGNSRALPALERAAADSEPLIREHATWAIEIIKKRQPQ